MIVITRKYQAFRVRVNKKWLVIQVTAKLLVHEVEYKLAVCSYRRYK